MVPLLLLAKEFSLPPVQPAATYPAHDTHPSDHLTVAADPYDTAAKAQIFSIEWARHDILPVLIIISNDGDRPATMVDLRINMRTGGHEKLVPMTEEDIYRRLTHVENPMGQSPRTFPLPKPSHPKGGVSQKEQDEIEGALFQAKAVEPHRTRAGFVFFDVADLGSPLEGAHLYVDGVRDATGHETMFFDISIDDYLKRK